METVAVVSSERKCFWSRSIMHLVNRSLSFGEDRGQVGEAVHLACVCPRRARKRQWGIVEDGTESMDNTGVGSPDFQPLRSRSADRATVHTADAIYVLLTIFHHVTRSY